MVAIELAALRRDTCGGLLDASDVCLGILDLEHKVTVPLMPELDRDRVVRVVHVPEHELAFGVEPPRRDHAGDVASSCGQAEHVTWPIRAGGAARVAMLEAPLLRSKPHRTREISPMRCGPRAVMLGPKAAQPWQSTRWQRLSWSHR
jgi:hypothetical protein